MYTNVRDIVASTEGEIRQQHENGCTGRLVGNEPTINGEEDGVRLIHPSDLDQYDIHLSMRQ